MARVRKRRKYKKYNVSSKNINIDRIKNKYRNEEEIELLDDYIYSSSSKKKFNIFSLFRKKSFYNWLLVVFLGIFALFLGFFVLVPKIELKGKAYTVINYKEKYKDAGFKATFQGKDISKFVTKKGFVNNKKLGSYKITYTVKYHGLRTKVVRYVEVKDISKPNISIEGDKDIYVCPNKTYEVPKYKAIDNYDGNLTNKVKITKEKDYILYSVTDSNDNKKEVKQKVYYKDREAPKIKFPVEDLYLYVGDKFEDNYEAIDNCDGNLTSEVKVDGKVDTSVPASYKLTYSVSDKALNKTEKTRKVVIQERRQNGTIYLTFDDGPKEGTTNVILDVLKQEGVKATFFVTNGGPDSLIKREYDEGHTVGLHTASHDYSYVYSSVENYYKDLNAVSDRVKRITGHESKIVRFPGGASNTISRRYSVGIMSTLTKDIVSKGYKYYDWNLSSGDAEFGNHSAEEIKNNVISHLSSERANIVLMHDIKPYTRDALRDIIRYGKANGYRFEKITMSTEIMSQKVNN